MNARNRRRFHRLAGVAALCLALPPATLWAAASWVPMGPVMINNGQAWDGKNFDSRVRVTGRINVVAPNPENPLDVWIGSAGGGVWHGHLDQNTSWQAMTDGEASLAVGSIALDNCSQGGCGTVWVGTGENSIRRDTQYGQGILKGQWNSATNVYDWTLLGQGFTRGAVTKIVLDPTTSGTGKVLFVALSTGQTSNGSQSTVTTYPPGFKGGLGIWRSKNAGQTWHFMFGHETPATDLEMDPQDPDILFAGLRYDGLYRSLDGGVTWNAMGKGIPKSLLAASDWPEIAVYRQPGMDAAILYTVLGGCPHPHEKATPFWCSPAVYASFDGGDNWNLAHAEQTPPPDIGTPLTSYASYTHALAIHPSDPYTLWYGGINLYKSTTLGFAWKTLGAGRLHPDHHQVVVVPWAGFDTGVLVFDVNDGGFFLGDGDDEWTDKYQHGLGVTQFQSVSHSGPEFGITIGGTQDNGTNLERLTQVWDHLNDGDSASTVTDLDSSKLYDVSVGLDASRCSSFVDFCEFSWPDINMGLGAVNGVSWYAPMVQSPAAVAGKHPLYFGTTELYRSVDGGDLWKLVPATGALGWPLATGTIADLDDIQNPISAIAVAPTNPDRIYIGFYGGQVFTTANGMSAAPVWTAASAGLPVPGRPVTSIAVHPADDQTAFAAFAGFGDHSVYRTTSGGTSWGHLDDSVLGNLSFGSVNTVAIEPQPPYAVWAGTDDGLYAREDADSLLSVWYRDGNGLPNAAVYDLDFSFQGQAVFAATHGRGVWLLWRRDGGIPFVDFNEAACCGYIDLFDPAPFISISGGGFEPLQSCAISLYEGGRLCSNAALDADGAALGTDAHGFLVAGKAGSYTDRKVSWACQGGTCAGGVPSARCEVSEIEIACGGRSARSAVKRAREVVEPGSTQLGFGVQSRDGSFTLTPTLKKTGGLSTPLCSVAVAYLAGDESERVLARAMAAVGADEGCRRAGVRARLAGASEPEEQEDEGPRPFRLALSAPGQTGIQLVTEVTGNGAAALTVEAYGSPQSQVVPRLAFTGRAAGGRIKVTERSPLGVCTFTVDTLAGDSPETVAAAVQRAIAAPPDPLTFTLLGDDCMPVQNARDAHLHGAELRFALGQQITVVSTDAGLGFTIGGDR